MLQLVDRACQWKLTQHHPLVDPKPDLKISDFSTGKVDITILRKCLTDHVVRLAVTTVIGKTEQAEVLNFLNLAFSFGEDSDTATSLWLTYFKSVNASCDHISSFTKLQSLNLYLFSKSVLVGNGLSLTIADIAMYVSVHDSVAGISSAERDGLPDLLRWMDYVQNKEDTSHAYEWISVTKPKFDPPAFADDSEASKTTKAIQASSDSRKIPQQAPVGTKLASEAEEKSPQTPVLKKESCTSKATQVLKENDVDISILDIKVGIINKVWKHPGADALYVEEIDIGESTVRQVVSGLANFLTEDQMLNRRVIVLSNVKPSKVRDVLSSGLVLCASNEDHTSCEPLIPPTDAAIGERVVVPGHEEKPEAILNPKKKQWEKLQPGLHTDGAGVACYQGQPFMTSGGKCTSSLFKAIVK